MITENSIVTFALSYQEKDKENFYIGNKNVNTFCEVPEEAVKVLSLFDGKRTIEEVKKDSKVQFQADIDVLDFVETLNELGLIYSLDGEIIGSDNEICHPQKLQRVADFFFKGNRKIIYLLLALTAFVVLIAGKMFPNYEDAIINKEYAGISIVAFFVLSWMITIIHEFGHFLSGIHLRIPTSFKLSLRYFMLVVEGDINGVWSVPRKQRYTCYLAGMCFEAVLIFIATVTKSVSHVDMVVKICNIVILVIILNYLRQFMLFIRTDLYFAILNLFNLNGIHMYLRQFMSKESRREINENLTKKERRYIKGFFCISILGLVFTLFYFISIATIYWQYFTGAIHEIANGDTRYIVDGICTLAVMLVGGVLWLIGLWGMLKGRREEE